MVEQGLTVVDIQPIDYDGDVYNLHIEDNHNYFANGINVSNCHKFKAAELTTIMETCRNASFRIGLTGTLDGKNLNELTVRGLFGDIHKIVTAKELIDAGWAADLEIHSILFEHSEADRTHCKKMEYAQEVAYLTTMDKRNIMIAKIASVQTKNTLILFRFKDHGKRLIEEINQRVDTNSRKVYYIDGGTPVVERERIRLEVESEQGAILVASQGVFSEGISIKNLHVMILASPMKDRIRLLQSVGRILRLNANKNGCTFIDIGDDLKKGKKINHSLRHFTERIEHYNSEKFNYTIRRMKLD